LTLNLTEQPFYPSITLNKYTSHIIFIYRFWDYIWRMVNDPEGLIL
jgi:hypothetical protein